MASCIAALVAVSLAKHVHHRSTRKDPWTTPTNISGNCTAFPANDHRDKPDGGGDRDKPDGGGEFVCVRRFGAAGLGNQITKTMLRLTVGIAISDALNRPVCWRRALRNGMAEINLAEHFVHPLPDCPTENSRCLVDITQKFMRVPGMKRRKIYEDVVCHLPTTARGPGEDRQIVHFEQLILCQTWARCKLNSSAMDMLAAPGAWCDEACTTRRLLPRVSARVGELALPVLSATRSDENGRARPRARHHEPILIALHHRAGDAVAFSSHDGDVRAGGAAWDRKRFANATARAVFGVATSAVVCNVTRKCAPFPATMPRIFVASDDAGFIRAFDAVLNEDYPQLAPTLHLAPETIQHNSDAAAAGKSNVSTIHERIVADWHILTRSDLLLVTGGSSFSQTANAFVPHCRLNGNNVAPSCLTSAEWS